MNRNLPQGRTTLTMTTIPVGELVELVNERDRLANDLDQAIECCQQLVSELSMSQQVERATGRYADRIEAKLDRIETQLERARRTIRPPRRRLFRRLLGVGG